MPARSNIEPPVDAPRRHHVRLLPRGSWLAVTLIFLFVLTEAAFGCLLPLGIVYFIETVQRTRNESALISLLTAIAIALALTLAAGLFRDFLFARLRSRALAGIRRGMFHRLQSLSMQFHAGLDRDQMLERFSTDLSTVEYAFSLDIL